MVSVCCVYYDHVWLPSFPPLLPKKRPDTISSRAHGIVGNDILYFCPAAKKKQNHGCVSDAAADCLAEQLQ